MPSSHPLNCGLGSKYFFSSCHFFSTWPLDLSGVSELDEELGIITDEYSCDLGRFLFRGAAGRVTPSSIRSSLSCSVSSLLTCVCVRGVGGVCVGGGGGQELFHTIM